MKISASEFKAKCLGCIDRADRHGQEVTITKRGRVVARLVPARDEDERPWLRVRRKARWTGDPLAPVIDEPDVDALR